MLKNLELWRLWLKDVSSPESYIDFGWFYLIGASLQRRVFCGPEKFPIYGNPYIIFVGDSGVGKGLVIRHVANVLKYHKLKPKSSNNGEPEKKESISNTDADLLLEAQNIANEILLETKNPMQQKKIYETPLLIPVAADSITYEQLVHRISKSTRGICYKETIEGKEVQKIYTHSSLCFCLEEVSSLLRKRTEDVANFLLNAWDCGDYTYETKTSGIDRIKRCCLSLLAGTTPTFMRRVFSDELLAEGIASRTIFVYEYANRFNKLRLPEYTEEQLNAYKTILEHIKQLTTLYGQVAFTPEADEWLHKYLYEDTNISRVNRNIKLGPYYAKKNLHLQKTAMAIHFSDITDLSVPITLDECKMAARVLANVESKMHFAVSLDGDNPLAKTAKEVFRYLRRYGPQKPKDLLIEFYGNVREAELKEILQYLTSTGRIEFYEGYYKVKPSSEKQEYMI